MARKAVVSSRASFALFGIASLGLAAGCGSKNDPYLDGGVDALYFEATLNITPPFFSFPDTAPNAMSEPKDFIVKNLGSQPTGSISIDLQSLPDATAFKITDTTCGKPLQLDEECQIRVLFVPKGQGDFTARLAVISPTGGTVTSSLSGSSRFSMSSALSLSPGFADFPSTSTSSGAVLPAPQAFTVTNTGSLRTGPLTVTLGGDSDFAKAEDSCVAPLDPGGQCTVKVRFKPTKAGARAGTLEVADSASSVKQTATLSGTGIKGAQLTLNPGGMFPDTAVGEAFSLLFTLVNSGEEPTGDLKFTQAGNTDQFMFDAGSCTKLPAADPGGQTFCSFTVTFAPKTVGPKSLGIQVSASPGGTANIQVMANATLQPNTTITLTQIGGNAFTGVPVGEMRTALFLVENTGTMMAGKPDAQLVGTNTEFGLMNNCTEALAPQDQCSIEVTFTPVDTTPQSVTLFVNANPGGNKAIQITSTAVRGGDLQFSNNGFHDFGTHSVAQVNNGTFTFTVRNGGTTQSGPITVDPVTGLNAADFLMVFTDCSNRQLNPGQTCSLRFRFQPLPPRDPRNRSASITVSATPGGRPQATFFGTANN